MTTRNAAAEFIAERLLRLKARKTQKQVAQEVGFVNPNMLAMIKSGASKVPLDRVPGLAKALECDAAYLFRLALEQNFEGAALMTVRQIFGAVLTKNETEWIEMLRDASGNTDPHITAMKAKMFRAIFGQTGA